MIKLFVSIIISFVFFSYFAYAKNHIDQWIDSDKTYLDLIEEGFEVKGYDTSEIKLDEGLILLLFISVLQKNKEVYECHEYQTLDNTMTTLDMSLVCRKLSQPFTKGLDT